MNAFQSLALSRTRASYGWRPEVVTVCDAAAAWFALQDLLTTRGYVNVTPQIVADLLPNVSTYAQTGSYVILREPVRLDEDPPDGEEDA